ncbi:hypothetical protein JXQ70_08255 [bacterium]|nr:hypothetical protein [bacterium]
MLLDLQGGDEQDSSLGQSSRFVTRLPATYACCGEVIEEAVVQGAWTEIGQIDCQSLSRTQKKARYRLQEGQVGLYGQTYRAVIVHSDVHDKRRQRKLARHLDQEHRALVKHIKGVIRQEFYCLPDAQQAAAALPRGHLHQAGVAGGSGVGISAYHTSYVLHDGVKILFSSDCQASQQSGPDSTAARAAIEVSPHSRCPSGLVDQDYLRPSLLAAAIR